jgi:hypothetical protein
LDGDCAFVLASHHGHIEIVTALLALPGAKTGGEIANTALRAAEESEEVQAFLREHGATLTLNEECHAGNAAAIAQLLDAGAGVEAMESAGITPLCAAAEGGHAAAVRLLLERGAETSGESGAVALRLAGANSEVCALLREHGAALPLIEECRHGNVAAIGQMIDGGTNLEANILGCDISPLSSQSDQFQAVKKYVADSHGLTHQSYKLEVQQVFAIARHGESERFETSGFAGCANRKLLWHGTRTSNYGGILSQGLRIAPPEAPANGYMFGKGIYFCECSVRIFHCSPLSAAAWLVLAFLLALTLFCLPPVRSIGHVAMWCG